MPRPGTRTSASSTSALRTGGAAATRLDLSQDLASGFGKIFRIDPFGSDSENGEYGIPADNPYAGDGDP